ncbi:translation elongation factor Ts [Guggenheimella bovis]
MAITTSMIKELREMTGAGMLDVKKALEECDGNMEAAVDYLREKGLAKSQKKSGRVTAEGLVAYYSENAKSGAVVEVNAETDFVSKNQEFVDMVDLFAKTAYENKISDVEVLKETNLSGLNQKASELLTEKIAKIGENMSLRRAKYVEGDVVSQYNHGNGRIVAICSFKTDATAEQLEEVGKDICMQIASMNPRYISPKDVDSDYIAREKEVLMQQALNENAELEAQGKKGKPVNIIEKMVEGRLQKELKDVCLTEQAFIKDGDLTVGKYLENAAKTLGKAVEIAEIVRYEVGEGIQKREENFAEEVQKQIG